MRGLRFLRGGRHRDPRTMWLLLQLFGQAYQLEGKRVVTLTLVGLMVLVYLSGEIYASRFCFGVGTLLQQGLTADVVTRFFIAPFVHVDDCHLYYNMGSLLWKGSQLEDRGGSVFFAVQVAVLAILSQLCAMGVVVVAALSGYNSWVYECAAGFSGVLFALKILLTANATGNTSVYGLHFISIPVRYAAWAELLVIYVLVPHSSFVGHLGGIIGGLVYLKLQRTGIFATVARGIVDIVGTCVGASQPEAAAAEATVPDDGRRDTGAGVGIGVERPRRGAWGSGTTGYRDAAPPPREASSGRSSSNRDADEANREAEADRNIEEEEEIARERDARMRDGMRRRYGGPPRPSRPQRWPSPRDAGAATEEMDAELAARLQAEENERAR